MLNKKEPKNAKLMFESELDSILDGLTLCDSEGSLPRMFFVSILQSSFLLGGKTYMLAISLKIVDLYDTDNRLEYLRNPLQEVMSLVIALDGLDLDDKLKDLSAMDELQIISEADKKM